MLAQNVTSSSWTKAVNRLPKNNIAHLVWRRGIGSEMQRNGSKVLLCFRQCGHVSEDLWERKHTVTLVLKNQLC